MNLEEVCAVARENAALTDSEARWPEKSITALSSAGLLGLTIPKEFGGAGAGMREFARVTEELATVCGSTAMIYLMHVCGAQVIAGARQRSALDGIVTGKLLTTLAFSEKGSRSHFWAPVSRAEQNGGGIRIRADKSFVTSAGHAQTYVVASGSVGGSAATESTLYLVGGSSAGVRTLGPWTGMGLRGNSSAPMVFDCVVGEDARLTAEGGGFQAMMQIVLPWFQVGSAAVSLGIAKAALADATRHVSSARLEHLGESLAAAVPGVRARIAKMQLTLDAARAYLNEALSKIENQAPDAMLAVLGVKATAAEAVVSVTDEAMRACGGAAFSRHLSIERNFRDARAASIMAPTTDILYDFIGKALCGLPLF
ncbi:MAG TPA: acyl-CoA dehydrogenase family protein [Terriglobia bacterium]|jgi:alkylation response protein AidB-like acyl-CoA dehydrogenase